MIFDKMFKDKFKKSTEKSLTELDSILNDLKGDYGEKGALWFFKYRLLNGVLGMNKKYSKYVLGEPPKSIPKSVFIRDFFKNFFLFLKGLFSLLFIVLVGGLTAVVLVFILYMAVKDVIGGIGSGNFVFTKFMGLTIYLIILPSIAAIVYSMKHRGEPEKVTKDKDDWDGWTAHRELLLQMTTGKEKGRFAQVEKKLGFEPKNSLYDRLPNLNTKKPF